jgi:hypothetical protein
VKQKNMRNQELVNRMKRKYREIIMREGERNRERHREEDIYMYK